VSVDLKKGGDGGSTMRVESLNPDEIRSGAVKFSGNVSSFGDGSCGNGRSDVRLGDENVVSINSKTTIVARSGPVGGELDGAVSLGGHNNTSGGGGESLLRCGNGRGRRANSVSGNNKDRVRSVSGQTSHSVGVLSGSNGGGALSGLLGAFGDEDIVSGDGSTTVILRGDPGEGEASGSHTGELHVVGRSGDLGKSDARVAGRQSASFSVFCADPEEVGLSVDQIAGGKLKDTSCGLANNVGLSGVFKALALVDGVPVEIETTIIKRCSPSDLERIGSRLSNVNVNNRGGQGGEGGCFRKTSKRASSIFVMSSNPKPVVSSLLQVGDHERVGGIPVGSRSLVVAWDVDIPAEGNSIVSSRKDVVTVDGCSCSLGLRTGSPAQVSVGGVRGFTVGQVDDGSGLVFTVSKAGSDFVGGVGGVGVVDVDILGGDLGHNRCGLGGVGTAHGKH